MVSPGRVSILLLFLVGIQCAAGYVFSCREVKGKLMNTNLEDNSVYACVVPQENFTAYDSLRGVYAQISKVSFGLTSIMETPGFCVQRPQQSGSWNIVADPPLNHDCDQEFTLIYTSVPPRVIAALEETHGYQLSGEEYILVSPRTGMRIRTVQCSGTGGSGPGDIIFYTGAGNGVAETRYLMHTYTCGNVPDWIVTFDNVLTIATDGSVNYKFEVSSDYLSEIALRPKARVAVLTSGKSDNLQNIRPDRNHATFRVSEGVNTRFSGSVQLDGRFSGQVAVVVDNQHRFSTFTNSTIDQSYDVFSSFQIHYITASDVPIWDSSDNVVLDIALGDAIDVSTEAPEPPTTTTKKTPVARGDVSPDGSYCGCGMNGDFKTDGSWKTEDIWMDIIFIIDVSKGMGTGAVGEVGPLIENIADGLTTDPKAPVYSRVGVISMGDEATVIYNLNRTQYDDIPIKMTDSYTFDVMAAFTAAQNMFNDGIATNRADRHHARQVIYYVSNSDPDSIENGVYLFKSSGGLILVNDFTEQGQAERPNLEELATPGYYFRNISDLYFKSYQPLCELNCFCYQNDAYDGGVENAKVKAAGGCFHVNPAGVNFGKAKNVCSKTQRGKMAAPHDANKEYFLNSRVSAVMAPRQAFWLGYSTTDGGKWTSEDGSTSSYTHWDPSEKFAEDDYCTYELQATGFTTYWHAVNCMAGFPSVCEMAPCSVGYAGCNE